MQQNDEIKFDVYVSPQTYVNLIKDANSETNAELKNKSWREYSRVLMKRM
jgi:hypothetical protein